MNYSKYNDLAPYFKDLIEEYQKEDPIDFLCPGEAVVTCVLDGICDEDYAPSCRALALEGIKKLKDEGIERIEEYFSDLVTEIDLLAGPEQEEKKKIIRSSLERDLIPLWDHAIKRKYEPNNKGCSEN